MGTRRTEARRPHPIVAKVEHFKQKEERTSALFFNLSLQWKHKITKLIKNKKKNGNYPLMKLADNYAYLGEFLSAVDSMRSSFPWEAFSLI